MTPSPSPPHHHQQQQEERFPRLERIFGRNWDDENAPDCFERWFGAATFATETEEDERDVDPGETRTEEKNGTVVNGVSKNLLDANWVKRKMDEEVWRLVQEAFEAEEATYWMRFRTALAIPFAAIAVGIHFIPLDSELYRTVSWALIYVFLFLFALWVGAGVAFAPLKTIVELKPTEKTGCGFFVESELDRLKLTYEVKIHNRNTPRWSGRSGVVVPEARVATKLHFNRFFTRRGEFAAEELRDQVLKMREEVYKQLGLLSASSNNATNAKRKS